MTRNGRAGSNPVYGTMLNQNYVQMTGYRQMINDRIPGTWEMALRYCGSKQRWIDYVYKTYVGKYNNDVMHTKKEKDRIKSENIRKICNAKRPFKDTIQLEIMLTYSRKDEYDYWLSVVKWVEWFQNNLLKIENVANIAAKVDNLHGDDLIKYIDVRFSLNNLKLSSFIINELGYD